VRPGDVVHIEGGGVEVRRQAARFVRHDPGKHADCAWAPLAREHLPGLKRASDRRELEQRLADVMTGGFARWLLRNLDANADATRYFVDYGVVWQLVVHTGGGERFHYALDFGRPALELVCGELEHANYFCHLGGESLLRALRTSNPAARNLFTCAELRVYEKILHVRDGEFWYPSETSRDLLMHRLPEPFVSFLALEYQGPVEQPEHQAPSTTPLTSNSQEGSASHEIA